MSYNFNSIPSVPPTGTVAPFTGTTDPSGWVICDGTTRSNASGQYNNLINAGLINQNTYSINTSTGSGISTNYLPATYTFNHMATSQNGQLILAGNNSSGYLYLSTNRGNTWAIQNNSLSANWFTTALSATTGQFMLAGNNSFLYLSTNTGTTWQPISGATFGAIYGLFTTTGNWSSSAISNAGQYMLAGMNTGSFYLSTSFGNSWRLLGGAANTNGMPTTAVNWTSCSMNALGSLMGACVSTGAVYLSTNTGTNWSTAYGLSTSAPWSEVSIASTANYVVAAANSGNIFLSLDGAGATWSQKSGLPTPPSIVAVGKGTTNTLAYSYDGITFTGLGATVFTTRCNAVASNGSRWVAVGSGGCSIAYSDDGINWTRVDAGSQIFSTEGQCVTWDGIRWIAGGLGTNVLAYSSNGVSWTPINTGISVGAQGITGIASSGSTWIGVGYGLGNYIKSTDSGNTWTTGTAPGAGGSWGITYANNRWIFSANSNHIYYSTNGAATFTLATGNNFVYNGFASAYSPTQDKWVAVGQGNSPNNFAAYSTNGGLTWVQSANGGSIMINDGAPSRPVNGYVAWTGTYWVVVGGPGTTGATNSIAYSADGITWTGLGTSIFSNYGSGIAWNGSSGGATGGLPSSAQAWQSLAISGDGTDIIAGTSASIIYASTTSGQTWTNLGGASNTIGLPNAATSNWSSMAISQDGNTWLADVNGAQMYISTDGFGKLWGIKAGYNVLGTGTWNALTISQDGTTVVAGNTASNLFVSYDSGNTYNALSSNGNLSGTKNWRGSTISSNNQIMTACATGDYVYLSSNSGLTWMSSLYQTTNSMLLGLPTITSSWQTISMDYTGTYHLAGINSGNLYLSTSSGKNWLSISGSNGIPGSASAWNTTTINSTGQYALAGINGGALYMSTNFATTWTAISGVANNLAWQTTAMNSTGEYMLAGTNNTVLYLSSNSGVYWNIIAGQAYSNALYGQGLPTVTGSWYTSAISSTGQYMATGLYGGAFYFSNNYGKKWNAFTGAPLSTSLNWQSMSMSSSGLAIVASVTGSNVYNIKTSVPPTATYSPPQISGTTSTDGTTVNYIIKI